MGTTTKRVAFNTFAQLIGKVITLTTTLLITVLITRRLGATGFGDFTIATTYAAFFYIIADFGLNAIVNQKLAQDRSPQSLFSNLLAIRLIFSTSLVLIGLLPLPFLPYSTALKQAIVISLLTITTQALLQVSTAFFQFNLKYHYAAAAAGLGRILTLVLATLAVFNGLNLTYVMASYVIGEALTGLIGLALVKRLVGKISLSFDVNLWQKLFLAALPLGLTAIFSVINQKADSIILSLLLTNREVGIYGAAYRIYEVVLVYPTFFMNAAYPVLLKHREAGLAKFRNSFKLCFLFLAGSALGAAAIGIWLAPWMISIVAGVEFAESVKILRILLVGLPILFPSALLWWSMIVLGKQKWLPVIYLGGALINIIANLVFIPHYGLAASAAITWLDEILVVVVTGGIVARGLRQSTH